MDKEELYELLDIEDGSDFTYFENLAELFETDKELPSDLIYELLSEIDLDAFREMCVTYFEQMQDAVPDDETDFYTLLENIKNVLVGMTESCSSEEEGEEYDRTLSELAEETARFHDWYTEEALVSCENNDTGEKEVLSVRDALYQSRSSKLTEESFTFDFSNAMDYELSEYSMSFADLADL